MLPRPLLLAALCATTVLTACGSPSAEHPAAAYTVEVRSESRILDNLRAFARTEGFTYSENRRALSDATVSFDLTRADMQVRGADPASPRRFEIRVFASRDPSKAASPLEIEAVAGRLEESLRRIKDATVTRARIDPAKGTVQEVPAP